MSKNSKKPNQTELNAQSNTPKTAPETDSAQPANDVEAPTSGNKPRWKADWLSIFLALVILLNVGLYVANINGENRKDGNDTSTSPGQFEPEQKQPGAPGGPDPGKEGGPDPSAAGNRPPSHGDDGRPPANSGGASKPGNDMDLATALTTLEGQVAIEKLQKQPAPLPLTSDQQKRLETTNRLRISVRNLGTNVCAIATTLKADQLAYLRKNKDRLFVPLTSEQPVQYAIKVLKPKAKGQDPTPVGQGNPSPPEFNPETISTGLVMLEKAGGALAITPSQAATICVALEQMAQANSFNGEDPENILNAKQVAFLCNELGILSRAAANAQAGRPAPGAASAATPGAPAPAAPAIPGAAAPSAAASATPAQGSNNAHI